jgi:uncharacterized protein (UPF0297 family)
MEDKDFRTQSFDDFNKIRKSEIKSTLIKVNAALKEKNYTPVNQLVGYILSGDPTYITGYNSARSLITKLERDELLEELLCFYLDNNQ